MCFSRWQELLKSVVERQRIQAWVENKSKLTSALPTNPALEGQAMSCTTRAKRREHCPTVSVRTDKILRAGIFQKRSKSTQRRTEANYLDKNWRVLCPNLSDPRATTRQKTFFSVNIPILGRFPTRLAPASACLDR
ncbi:hypothetical protein ACMFWY_08420 [Roseiconus sp. JC912]|uniref:hypothetical protein n=1 Tax=Roseiconus sp. JC912 TaxID=3396307 RepID=UPI003A4C53E3